MRSAVSLVAGLLVSLVLIGGSLSGLDGHILSVSGWAHHHDATVIAQVVPDPPPPERIDARVLSLPAQDVGGQLDPPTPTPTSAPAAVTPVLPAAPATPVTHIHQAASRGDGQTITPVASLAVDSDGDGLSDQRERLYGTDPLLGDSDGDGIPDPFEVVHRLDPVSASDAPVDIDGDGVSNRNEYLVTADPRAADTNGDGIDDGADDFDGDGVPNAIEQRLGLNPSTPVTRAGAAGTAAATAVVAGTGAPATRTKTGDRGATIEQRESAPVGTSGATVVLTDGQLDSDGDGVSNADEVAAGTDPANPASKPVTAASVEQQPGAPEEAPNPADATETPQTETDPADPAPTDPAPTEPAPAEPAPTDPAPADPGPSPPVAPTTDTPASEPVPEDAPAADPATGDVAPAP
jgi:hypothetical protein